VDVGKKKRRSQDKGLIGLDQLMLHTSGEAGRRIVRKATKEKSASHRGGKKRAEKS